MNAFIIGFVFFWCLLGAAAIADLIADKLEKRDING